MKSFAIVLLVALLALMGYIRLSPMDAARWHVASDILSDADEAGGVVRRVPGGAARMAELDAIIRATPRTRVLAGSVDSGLISYVTRSRVMGFPDVTTVQTDGDALVVHARLRFGRSDLGVNRARVEGWLAALAEGGS